MKRVIVSANNPFSEQTNVATRKKSDYPILTCTPKSLPKDAAIDAARVATDVNPMNRPRLDGLLDLPRSARAALDKTRLSVLTTKYWRTNGVKLTVGFLDNPEPALRKRIVEHMNAWSKTANVEFKESKVDPQVRIARLDGDDGGYWSYLGTDVLLIDKNEPTMNLEGFTMATPESEFRRVVRHETGHTLGFPHEHMRGELIELIDRAKAFKYFKATQGWSQKDTENQVLTPIEEESLLNPTAPDPFSIMCYQIPGAITKNGQPIAGGVDIDAMDYAYAGQVYPKPGQRTRAAPAVNRFHASLSPATAAARRLTGR